MAMAILIAAKKNTSTGCHKTGRHKHFRRLRWGTAQKTLGNTGLEANVPERSNVCRCGPTASRSTIMCTNSFSIRFWTNMNLYLSFFFNFRYDERVKEGQYFTKSLKTICYVIGFILTSFTLPCKEEENKKSPLPLRFFFKL